MANNNGNRVATPARWASALACAQANIRAGAVVMRLDDLGFCWAVSSAREPERGYMVTFNQEGKAECSCPAAETGDDVCWHRSAIMARLGIFPDGEQRAA